MQLFILNADVHIKEYTLVGKVDNKKNIVHYLPIPLYMGAGLSSVVESTSLTLIQHHHSAEGRLM